MYSRETSCLNEYNFETYCNIHSILKNEKSCAVVQPTGTGKSYIMMELLKYFKDSWKIVIAPSRDFLNNMEQNKYWVSEKTLTLTYSFIGINCNNVAEALAEYKIHPDSVGLIILDELHRAGAPKWGAGVKTLMNLCKNAKTVGLTATPKRYDEGRDMVEELFDGRLAKNMNLAEAIKLGIVPQLSYVVGMHSININIDELRLYLSNENHMKYIENMINNYEREWNFTNYFVKTLTKYIDNTDKSGKHIVFASSIEEAEKMADVVSQWFKKLFNTNNISVYCIHSKQAKKSELIEGFFGDNTEGEVKVAVAVNMLNESFHCKDIRTISMFRGTQSINVYMQQIGRAISANGNIPYIFDFVDNYHSIEALQEMLSTDTLIDMEDTYDTKSFVFKDFNDETFEFVKDISKIRRLIRLHPETVLNEIDARMNESDDNIVFSIPDNEFVNWASYALKNTDFIKHKLANDSVIQIYDNLRTSIDINKSLGYEWYKLYKTYLDDKLKLSDLQIKKLSSDYNKACMLNKISQSTIDYFKSKGISCGLIKNEDKLINLINKNEPKRFRHKEKLLSLTNLIENGNKFELYKAIIKLEETFNSQLCHTYSSDMVGDAAAYWLWIIYKDRYISEIQKIKDTFTDYMYLDIFMNTAKKNRQTVELEHIIKVNELIKNIEELDELDENVLYILDYHKVRKIERLYDCICKQLHLDVDEENLKARLKYQVTLDKIEDSFKNYAQNIKDSAYSHMCLDNYIWADAIMDRYNKLIDACDAIINYIDNPNNEEYSWFKTYVKQSKEDFIYSKSKKSHSAFKYSANNKLSIAYNTYNNLHAIEEELNKDYIDNFREEFSKAYSEWETKHGNAENNTMFIAMVAMSRSEVCTENIGVNKLSYKLQKVIVVLFDWLLTSEHIDYTREANADSIKSVYYTFEMMGNNTIYLAASAMSKRNREIYINMYNYFLTTGKVLSKNAMLFYDDTTDKDNQILYDIKNSSLIKSFNKYNKFNELLYKAYENLD